MFNLFKKSNLEQSKVDEDFYNENTSYKVAIILDGKVVDVITCNARMCAILTSNPTLIGFSSKIEDANNIKPGWTFKDGIFRQP
jgi:hypothetical protein